MKVFLTGGSGYIGRATIRALCRSKHSVEALARTRRAAHIVTAAGALAVRGGLEETSMLSRAARRADAVIHLAQADSHGTALAAAAALQNGVGPGTYVHTGGVWSFGDTHGVADEDATMTPPSAVAWWRPVIVAVLLRAEHGGRPVVVHPGLTYGGESRLFDTYFTSAGRRAGAVPYIGEGSNRWSLVHLEDLARLYVAALQAEAGSVFLGVDGTNPTMYEVAAALSHRDGIGGSTTSISLGQARSQMGPFADAFALDQQFTAARARALLGWRPIHTDPLHELARGRHRPMRSPSAGENSS